MISILAFFLGLTDYKISFLSLADVAILGLVFFSFVSSRKLLVNKRELLSVGLLLLGTFMAFLFNYTEKYFSVIEFFKSFMKLLLYIIACWKVPNLLNIRRTDVVQIVRCFLYCSVIAGVLQLVIVHCLGLESWPLYAMGGQWFGLQTYNTMLVNNGMIRARSFFSEPAAFTTAISIYYALLLFKGSTNRKKMIYDTVFYFIGIASAQSVSGFGIAVLLVMIYFLNFRDRKKCIRMLALAIPGIIVLLGIFISNEYIRSRIINLFALKDHSGVVRTLGGFYFLKEVPWYGVGIGNNAAYYFSIDISKDDLMWYSGSGEFYNWLLVAIITMGYIGAIGLVAYLFSVLKKDIKLFFIVLVIGSATGRLFTPTLWVFLIFYKTINQQTISILNVPKEIGERMT